MKFPEQFRWAEGPHPMYASKPGDDFGFFMIPARHAKGRILKCMVASGAESKWDHVSVSLPEHRNKCASWREMCLVKDLFFDPTDCVVQYHPPKEDNISHAEVLHLWRPTEVVIPMPPKICV